MKTSNMCATFSNSAIPAKHARSTGTKAISAATLAFLFLAIISATGCVGLTGAPKTSSSTGSAAGAGTISVAPASIQFGAVSLGETVSQSVTIRNDGTSSATIMNASATAAGVKLTGIALPLTIGPGNQSTFNVVFSPKTAGALAGAVTVTNDISSAPSTISLSGTGTAATTLLTASTSALSFGTVTIGKSSTASVTLTNAGNSNITVSKVSASGASYFASGVSAGLILTPGQSATLDEIFTPAIAGTVYGSITVASNASNSPATVSLSGAGTQTSPHTVALSWNPSPSVVAGYEVFRAEVSGGPYTRLDASVIAANAYVDSTVQAGQIYYYVITSVTPGGVQSADSTEASAAVPNL